MELLELRGPEFLAWYLLLGTAALVVALILRQLARPRGSTYVVDDPYEAALLEGGSKGLALAVIGSLIHRKVIEVVGRTLKSDQAPTETLRPVEELVLGVARLGMDVRDAVASVSGWTSETEKKLVERRLLMTDEHRIFNALVTLVPLIAVLVLGFAKVRIGVDRGRPVGILLFFLLGTLVVMAIVAVKTPRVMKNVSAALAEARSRNEGLRETGRSGTLGALDGRDVALGVALFGLGPFVGTSLGPLQAALSPPPSSGGFDSGSSCSSSCGSSCGGGCGGGCGGCGG